MKISETENGYTLFTLPDQTWVEFDPDSEWVELRLIDHGEWGSVVFLTEQIPDIMAALNEISAMIAKRTSA